MNATSHGYLQSVVKRVGEKNGYLATVEKEVFGGVGKIDVALDRDDLKIACEISVTNTADYELANLRKCLAAGYQRVVMIAADAGHLARIRQNAQTQLPLEQFEKIAFLMPDDFDSYLENATLSLPEQSLKVKGYEVSVDYAAADEADEKSRVKSVASTILNFVRRRKKNG